MKLLVRKARKGDKAAFQQLMEEQGISLYKIAKAILKNDDDAADAMQETALVCWEKLGTLKKDDFFKTWMTKIHINNCNQIYRERQHLLPEEEIPEASAWENGFEHAEWGDFLNRLDEKYRIVIILHYIEGFRAKEISQILDISESAVYVRLTRAREMMRQQYEVGGSPGEDRETIRLKKMVSAHLAGSAIIGDGKGDFHGQI
ncbi:MAG: sigma-70 family RNA polymerase sigma factor [Lachnospiraceae bacterium]|nr:sigma-70 family RNA polymerase sigma factor [Lachnospiraceae bacterium]